MKDFNVATHNSNEWLTPPKIIRALGLFDLDPCAPIVKPWATAVLHYTRLDDGLAKEWRGRVWLNPPYGRETFRWVYKLADHGNGIALIFARTETAGFHREVWERAHSVFFFEGRLRFYLPDGKRCGSAPAPSCLVSYSASNTASIEAAISSRLLAGKLVRL